MSGPIRSQIGLAKVRLVKNSTSVKNLMDAQISQDVDSYERRERELVVAMSKFKLALENLERLDTNWQTLLISLKGQEEYPTESALYEHTAANETTGYLILCAEAHEFLCDIDGYLSDIRTFIDKAKRSQDHVQANDSISQVGSNQGNLNPSNLQGAGQGGSSIPPSGYTAPPNINGASARPRDDRRHLPNLPKPKLVLPNFNGDPIQWPPFWSFFSNVIDQRTDLTDIEKLTYLVPLLKGTAQQVISGVVHTGDNYPVVVALLKRRFDQNVQQINTKLYQQLYSLPAAGRKIEDIRKTYDSCEQIFRQMGSIGEDMSQPLLALTFLLLKKFPSYFVTQLHEYGGITPNSHLSGVRDAINDRILVMELRSDFIEQAPSKEGHASSNNSSSPSNKRITDRNRPNRFQGSTNARSFPRTNSSFGTVSKISSERSKANPPSNCYFCGQLHFNMDCRKYPTAKDRINRLKQLERCTRCARKHFNPGTCTVPIRCTHCKTENDHTSVLCSKEYKANAGASAKSPSKAPFNPSSKNTVHSAVSVEPKEPIVESEDESNDVANFSNEEGRCTLFQTATTFAINPDTNKRVKVRLCFDTLSNRSYIMEPIANGLGLKGEAGSLKVSTFGSKRQIQVPSKAVEFDLLLENGSLFRVEASTTRLINSSKLLPNRWPKKEYQILRQRMKNSQLADNPFDRRPIDILIGADYVWQLITGVAISTPSAIKFIPTKFGHMLAGLLPNGSNSQKEAISMLCISNRSTIESDLVVQSDSLPKAIDVDRMWSLEAIGITEDPHVNDDDVALAHFESTVQFSDGRYQVTWPWIEDRKSLLPSNYSTAFNRFKSMAKRLERDTSILKAYEDTIQLQVDRGIIELVPTGEERVEHSVHYLPHHPVVKLCSSTTKVRIVYDASSRLKRSDLSLNDCMYRGPVILPDLCQLLMRLRAFRILVTSDIEKAFLQVSLQKQERDVTRFLWFKDTATCDFSSKNLAIYRFCRVPFGVISSPFLLGATIQHHLSAQKDPFCEALKRDVYVDNVISGCDTDNEAIRYYQRVKEIFDSAGMNLTEFCSNSVQLMDHIPTNHKVNESFVKVLGLKWDSAYQDTLQLTRSAKFLLAPTITKRSVLQSVAALFDPLGFFLPAFLPAKLFLQKLWMYDYGWDNELDSNLVNEWEGIHNSLNPLFDIKIQRYVGSVDSSSQLIAFCDASAASYGSAIYLRTCDYTGKWQTNLIFAKSRLAPVSKRQGKRQSVKSITIPRLELLGMVLGAKMLQFCRGALSMMDSSVYLFTDSECVLHWIATNSKLQCFVERRLEIIRSVSRCTFRHVGTAENPADYLTRGILSEEIDRVNLWWYGPNWINQPQESWPQHHLGEVSSDALLEYAKNQPVLVSHTFATIDNSSLSVLGIDLKRFSSLQKLYRVTALCFKFLRKRCWSQLSPHLQGKFPNLVAIGENEDITAPDLDVVESLWVKSVQTECFASVFRAIEDKRNHCLIRQLGLRLDSNGLLRTYCRYEKADISTLAKFPALLPKGHLFSRLVVLDFHCRLGHVGLSHTLSQIRTKFWLIHGRAYVRSILNRCIICRRFRTAQSFKLPAMPPWPIERTKRALPFAHAGLDYFGPCKIKIHDNEEKMWGCLFTCLVTRAIHLEAVIDCSSAQFLQALIRFVSRRGCPETIFCDNAGQFRLANILLDKAWTKVPTDPDILYYSATYNIRWKFITELAPWQGGHYERLVGVVKNVLKVTIGRRLLTWSEFSTLLIETEAIVNTRPITYIDNDPDSLYRVLTPNDFLTGAPLRFGSDDTQFSIRDLGDAGKLLAGLWKQRQGYLNKLWDIWYNDYLLSLRERVKLTHQSRPGANSRSPREGEVVLLKDDDIPRGSWKLGRITDIIPSTDQKIRAVTIQLATGVKINRAINCIIPLEIDAPVNQNQNSSNLSVAQNISNWVIERGSAHPDFDICGVSIGHEEAVRIADSLQKFSH